MRRTLSLALAGVALIASVAACDSGKKGTSSSSSAAPTGGSNTSASSGQGAGTATVKVANDSVKLTVTCTKTAKQTQATGNENSDAVTLTVQGTPVSAVLVRHAADGSTTIYQAIQGLRDDNGKALGKITVSADGDTYSGTGTFVLTKIDAKGKRVKLKADTTVAGTFQLACSQGYAAVPTPSAAPTTKSSGASSTKGSTKASTSASTSKSG